MSTPTRRLRGRSLLGAGSALALALSAVTAGVALNASATAETSTASASPTDLHPGDTFHVQVQLYNPESFTINDGAAQLNSIVGLVDLVGCGVDAISCGILTDVIRGNVGPVGPGVTKTVDFTLKVKQNAVGGTYSISHQFVGSNYAFGPTAQQLVLTISDFLADVAVSIGASTAGLLLSTEVRYAISAANAGPGATSVTSLKVVYPQGTYISGGSGCAGIAGTNTAKCELGAIPAGSTRSVSLFVRPVLLKVGPFTTTVSRVASSPADPLAANDTASVTCAALTSLLVRC